MKEKKLEKIKVYFSVNKEENKKKSGIRWMGGRRERKIYRAMSLFDVLCCILIYYDIDLWKRGVTNTKIFTNLCSENWAMNGYFILWKNDSELCGTTLFKIFPSHFSEIQFNFVHSECDIILCHIPSKVKKT